MPQPYRRVSDKIRFYSAKRWLVAAIWGQPSSVIKLVPLQPVQCIFSLLQVTANGQSHQCFGMIPGVYMPAFKPGYCAFFGLWSGNVSGCFFENLSGERTLEVLLQFFGLQKYMATLFPSNGSKNVSIQRVILGFCIKSQTRKSWYLSISEFVSPFPQKRHFNHQ